MLNAVAVQPEESPRFKRATCGCLVGGELTIVCRIYRTLVDSRAALPTGVGRELLDGIITAHERSAGA